MIHETLSANKQISTTANRFVRPFFAVAFVYMLLAALFTDAIYDLGDGITHYEFARWSWKHPELLLHHWAKPFFTLLSSPFAQFGYKGIVVFNVLCHFGAAWVTWRIADRMKLHFAFLAGPLVIFAPISWGVAQSGLTEPLFALTLMSGIYFITGGRNSIAALLISLLPLARTEGFFLAPLFGLFFLVRREYVAMCLLAGGTLLYSTLGAFFVHHDFLWLLHGNPYTGEADYGHGTLTHFIDKNEFIMGWAMTLFSALGLATLFFRKRFTPAHSIAEIILVFGSFIVFFVMHSVFWWKGLFGSYGLIRVMVCIVPCIALVSLRGVQLATRAYERNTKAVVATLIVTIGLTAFNTFNHYGFILHKGRQQDYCQTAADAIAQRDQGNRTIYFGHPCVRFFLNRDPFDPSESRQLSDLFSVQVPGAYVVWDSHFGPVQYNMNEAQLLAEPSVTELERMDYRNEKDGELWVLGEVK